MAVFHTPDWALKGGNRTGKFNVSPRRDKISSGGELIKTPGFALTIPRNGILDTDNLNYIERQQGEVALGPDWKAKTDEFIRQNLSFLSLVEGSPVKATSAKAEKTEAVVDATNAAIVKINQGRTLSQKG